MDLAALPFPLRWLSLPAEFDLADEALTMFAGPRCDWFVDPDGVSEPVLNAPALVGEPEGDFILSARVTVDFAATYDAGVLVLFGNDRAWAKLCFEYAPAGERWWSRWSRGACRTIATRSWSRGTRCGCESLDSEPRSRSMSQPMAGPGG